MLITELITEKSRVKWDPGLTRVKVFDSCDPAWDRVFFVKNRPEPAGSAGMSCPSAHGKDPRQAVEAL